jgi:NAD(P)-dependent dehydrogenase (short-subunit alcohol dehydrogenase family)
MTNPKCLIIGAAGGIGRELAATLHAQGWELILAGRNLSPLEPLAAEFSATVRALDASDFAAVDSLFGDHPGITAAANLAGSILLKPAHLTSEAEFAETISQNLKTAFALIRAAGRHMKSTGGSVVLMSSCAAGIGLANHEAISAAKAGIEGLVRSAAATYASTGIRFNAVAPGLVATPMARRITENEGALKASIAMHPLGRIGNAREIAAAIAFLLAPDNNWITGQTLGVDGGLSRLKVR